MKNIILTIAVLLCIGSATNAQEVTDKQFTLITKRTADWCPKCGAWGWDFFNQVKDANKDKNVIVWAAHFSGGLSNQVSKDIAINFGGSGQPLFFYEGDNLNVSSGNIAAKVAEVNTLVGVSTSFEAFYKVGSKVEVGEENVSVKQKVEFAIDKESGGDLYLATYLMQKRRLASQSGQSGQAEHKNLIVASLAGSSFGKKLDKSSFTAGETVELNTEISADAWNYEASAYEVVTILWALEDGKYNFLNGNIQQIDTQSNVEDVEELSFKAYVNNGLLNIDMPEALSSLQARIYDMSGKVLAEHDLASSNLHIIDVTGLKIGNYILELQGEDLRGTQKFQLR